jgi:serpin B
LNIFSGSKGKENVKSTNKVNIKRLLSITNKTQTQSKDVDLTKANSKFAFEMFKALNDDEKEKNLFYSPISVSIALSMLYQGADNDTKKGIEETLNYNGIDKEVLNKDYKELISKLENVDENVKLNIANSIWAREGFKVKDPFIETNKDVFGAEVRNLDFGQAEAANIINEWISEKTNKMIEKMIEPPISDAVIMYLINAIYFYGNWTTSFDPERTYQTNFTTADEKQKQVDMMRKKDTTLFGRGDDYVAVSLPYGEEKVSMYCVMPNKDVHIDNFIENLNEEKFAEIKDSLKKRGDFSVNIPKFKMEYGKKSLKNILKNMGMKDSFEAGKADFSGISDEDIFVSDVLHKAVIDVNEEGTEAAAVTVVVMERTSVKRDYFLADRPFLFFIVDDTTDSILFMGKAADLGEDSGE